MRVRGQSSWEADIPRGRRHAAFDISVGNKTCGGPYLVAQMRWALKRFDTFELSVADTLAVHTYMSVGHPVRGVLGERAAREVALQEGAAWLDLNLGHITSELPFATEINTWDRWMRLPAVQEHLASLRAAFDDDLSLRSAVRGWIGHYLDRRKVDPTGLTDLAWYHLDQYVLEELAVYQHQVEKRNAVNIYPGLDLATYDPLLRVATLPRSLRDRHFVTLRM